MKKEVLRGKNVKDFSCMTGVQRARNSHLLNCRQSTRHSTGLELMVMWGVAGFEYRALRGGVRELQMCDETDVGSLRKSEEYRSNKLICIAQRNRE
ncbi:hypothetical protein Bpfe_007753 [Biomphalaria pfeifferi]|uniref:Uncharacterized protein n=1 Tax=Biomphalaria pfeifferi TaxID=112525 RepID=A0AAD8FGH6_BIOPF|nr:hypothetical protein Bpfe_007753 [Biomphalaria pfeifferi]